MAYPIVGAKPLSEPMLEFVDWTVMNMFQWHLNRNAYIFIQENAFQNVVCKMAAVCLGLNVLIQSQRASSVGLKPKNYPATLWSSEYVFCWVFLLCFIVLTVPIAVDSYDVFTRTL